MTGHPPAALVDGQPDVFAALVPIAGREIVELGCGAAKLACPLLARHPHCRLTRLEIGRRQHARNLAAPQPGLQFVAAGAQAIPLPDASFDVALMLESLHHVALRLLTQALAEVRAAFAPYQQADGAHFTRALHTHVQRRHD